LNVRPLVMGILNVTPDSFSDGGNYPTVEAVFSAARSMLDEGADLLDVGGESTRPGAEPVSLEEELKRVMPVVEILAKHGFRISVDTSKAEVARQALAAGASMINDVTALGEPEMAKVCAETGCEVCLMHMQGTPRTMQLEPRYEDVVSEVADFLVGRARFAEQQGIARDAIWIDPGFGFGKTDEHNLAMARGMSRFVSTLYPVLIGVSRKGFVGRTLGGAPLQDRLPGSLALQVLAQVAGIHCIRTHDVAATRRAIEMTYAIEGA
jgi:dihydropteroate synthase